MRGQSVKGPLSPEHREILARIVARDPEAGYQSIRAEFRGLAGRDVSSPTVTKARRNAEIVDSDVIDGPSALRRAGPGIALTDDDRSVLAKIFKSNSNATSGQVCKIFQSRTGKKISSIVVRNYRSGRLSIDRPKWMLTDSQRKLLFDIARESGPHYCRAQIAREFTELSGRPISREHVSSLVRKYLNLPALHRGVNSHIGRTGDSDSAILEASRRKLESAPVDKSPRIGRASRLKEKGLHA